MNLYVICPRHPQTQSGPVNALPRLFASAAINAALPAATMASAFDRMAWHTGRPDCKLKSIAKYKEAVKIVSGAIKDDRECASDHLLQAVILLGLWEVSANHSIHQNLLY